MHHCALLSATERFLSQPLVCGTVFRHTSPLPPLSPSSAVVLNHISSHFLIPLSDSSLICTVPAQWLVILDTIIVACSRKLLLSIVIIIFMHLNVLTYAIHICSNCVLVGTRFSVKIFHYKPWTSVREVIYCLGRMNFEHLFYKKKLCFLHSLMCYLVCYGSLCAYWRGYKSIRLCKC